MEHFFSRSIIQPAESPYRTHEICIPAYSYSRFVSLGLMSFNSAFHNSYLHRHDNEYTVPFCANCSYSHTSTRFCLPYLYSPYELDFLIDFLEYTPQNSISPSLFLSLIRLCDYCICYLIQPLLSTWYIYIFLKILQIVHIWRLWLTFLMPLVIANWVSNLPQIISPFFEVLRSPSVFT